MDFQQFSSQFYSSRLSISMQISDDSSLGLPSTLECVYLMFGATKKMWEILDFRLMLNNSVVSNSILYSLQINEKCCWQHTHTHTPTHTKCQCENFHLSDLNRCILPAISIPVSPLFSTAETSIRRNNNRKKNRRKFIILVDEQTNWKQLLKCERKKMERKRKKEKEKKK